MLRITSAIALLLLLASCTKMITSTNAPLTKEYRVKRINSKRHGMYREYLDNFKLTEGRYVNDKRNGAWIFYNKSGLIIKGNYKNDLPEGEWKYYRNDKLIFSESYSNGRTVTGTQQVHEEPTTIQKDEDGKETVYTVVQEMPEFNRGGVQDYLGKTVQYPDFARELGITGRIWIEFVVNKRGEVQDVKVVKSPPNTQPLEKEALRAVKELPRFTPGFQGGKPVSVRFTVPINFSIK